MGGAGSATQRWMDLLYDPYIDMRKGKVHFYKIAVPTSGRTGTNSWDEGSRRNLK